MNEHMTVECDIHIRRCGQGYRKELVEGQQPELPVAEMGRIPRVARLMALALRFEELVRSGMVNYAALAAVGHVSRARLTQIANLTCLAPDIQEQVLFLPRTEPGRRPILIRQLQPIALMPD